MSFKNRFGLSEWSGAVGDLGILVPIGYALATLNGFDAGLIFLLWGVAYLLSGWYFKIPLSIQPLKAMAVLALGLGLKPDFIAGTAIVYGALLLVLSLSGVIRWLQRWFTPPIVRGIQVGIGLILAQKAVELIGKHGLLLPAGKSAWELNAAIALLLIALLFYFQVYKKHPLGLWLLLIGAGLAAFFSSDLGVAPNLPTLSWHLPHLTEMSAMIWLLIIPQLPLTLGNAMYAAADSCQTFWPERSKKINAQRLGVSIGALDIGIGLAGGFPVCHGAGGIGAHAQFGGKTGGTTIILGTILIAVSLTGFTRFLLWMPTAILGALLVVDSLRMVSMVRDLRLGYEWLIAGTMALIAFWGHNLSLALIFGIATEFLLKRYRGHIELQKMFRWLYASVGRWQLKANTD